MAEISETLFRHLALTLAGRSIDRITNNLWFLLKLNYAFSIAEAFISSMRNGISRRSRSPSAENRFHLAKWTIELTNNKQMCLWKWRTKSFAVTSITLLTHQRNVKINVKHERSLWEIEQRPHLFCLDTGSNAQVASIPILIACLTSSFEPQSARNIEATRRYSLHNRVWGNCFSAKPATRPHEQRKSSLEIDQYVGKTGWLRERPIDRLRIVEKT